MPKTFDTMKGDGSIIAPRQNQYRSGTKSVSCFCRWQSERPVSGIQRDKYTFEAIFGPSASFCFCGFKTTSSEEDGWVSDFPVALARRLNFEVYLSESDGLHCVDQHGGVSTVLNRSKCFDFIVFRTRGAIWANARRPLIRNSQQWFLYPMCYNLDRVRRVGRVRILQDDHFVKPLGLKDEHVFYRDDETRGDALVIVGSLKPSKGQVAVARALSAEVLARHELVFCGTIRDLDELALLERSLKERGAHYRILGRLSKVELAELFRRAYAVLCPSSQDWNPRVVTEALSCGAPVVVSDCVALADALRPFIVQRPVKVFNDAILGGLAQARPRPPAGFFSLEPCMARVFSESMRPRSVRECIYDSLAWLQPHNGRGQRRLFRHQLF